MTVVDTLKHAVGADSGNNGATRQEMSDARLPLAYRDSSCSKLLISLNKCRVKEYYLPWKCEDERHGYEKCMYDDFLERSKKMDELKEKAKSSS